MLFILVIRQRLIVPKTTELKPYIPEHGVFEDFSSNRNVGLGIFFFQTDISNQECHFPQEHVLTADRERSKVKVDTGQVESVDSEQLVAGDSCFSAPTIAFPPTLRSASENSSCESELLNAVNCAVCGLKFLTEEECAAHMDQSHNASALGQYK